MYTINNFECLLLLINHTCNLDQNRAEDINKFINMLYFNPNVYYRDFSIQYSIKTDADIHFTLESITLTLSNDKMIFSVEMD